VGEVFNSIWDCKQLIEEQLIDYIRATVVHAGGITHLRKIATLADLYGVRTGCHGATDLSPVSHGRGPALRPVDPQFRHPGVHAPHAETDAVFPHAYSFSDGMMHPWRGARPGRGDRRGTGRGAVPLSRAYLPVARRLDGSMHDW
jgi:mannonate dehydratase